MQEIVVNWRIKVPIKAAPATWLQRTSKILPAPPSGARSPSPPAPRRTQAASALHGGLPLHPVLLRSPAPGPGPRVPLTIQKRDCFLLAGLG